MRALAPELARRATAVIASPWSTPAPTHWPSSAGPWSGSLRPDCTRRPNGCRFAVVTHTGRLVRRMAWRAEEVGVGTHCVGVLATEGDPIALMAAPAELEACWLRQASRRRTRSRGHRHWRWAARAVKQSRCEAKLAYRSSSRSPRWCSAWPKKVPRRGYAFEALALVGMRRHPMSRDIELGVSPLCHVVEQRLQVDGARGMPDQPHVQPDRHHLRCLRAFLVEHIEGIADDWFSFIRDAFDMLYKEGAKTPKMMSVGLHMRLIGHPARAVGLERLLDHSLSTTAFGWRAGSISRDIGWRRIPTKARAS